ncbi:hypothetical protein C4E24_01070 [ANME-1 cluster archaeon AG-394-G21]|nr:hypothetical protein [ANME-1 cluster archaeon AG-394-G21]
MQKLKADNKTMDAIKQIVRVSKDREIRIKVPLYIPENEIAEVILIIRKTHDSFKQKISELKEAMREDLFLDDLIEISEDFKAVDLDGWEREGV